MLKKWMLTLMAGLLALQLTAGEKVEWQTDAAKAQATAKAENKLVLMDFTGSDWCVWCKKLNKEIFSTTEFTAYAAKNLVLVEVDFPKSKAQSAAQKEANQNLAKKYKVQGYPTVIVLNGEGKMVGELGYMEGGPKAFLAELAKLKKSAS